MIAHELAEEIGMTGAKDENDAVARLSDVSEIRKDSAIGMQSRQSNPPNRCGLHIQRARLYTASSCAPWCLTPASIRHAQVSVIDRSPSIPAPVDVGPRAGDELAGGRVAGGPS